MLAIVLFYFGVVVGGVFLGLSWYEVYGLVMLGASLVVVGGYREILGFWGLSGGLGMDVLSWTLLLLSVWVGGLMIMSRVRVLGGEYMGLLSGLVLLLIITFSVMDYLWFYVFFESSLIPILLIILGWGYQPERLQAGIYMLFYTLFGSLPLLVSFLLFMGEFHSLGYDITWWCRSGRSVWLFFSVLAFLVKMPMFLVHLWLPRAHVEAPVAGSMILAGVLLKLGGYGLLRFLWVFLKAVSGVGGLVVGLSVLGAFLVSLICLRQYDLRALIAYSSVSHMGLVLGGLFTMNGWGWQGALVLILGHGLCSSGLFCLANLVYERLGSRSLLVGRGLLGVFPGMALWWFLLGVRNMASPPRMNLIGEIMLLISLVGWSGYVILGLVGVSFFSAAYTLYMYSMTQHGKLGVFYGFKDCRVREYLLLFLHWIPLNFFILKRDLLFLWG